MIRGDVVDPILTLDNADIVRRHIRAFLLQNYHQHRIPEINPDMRHDLFSVLGTVSDFRSGESVLNRADFEKWLAENEDPLKVRVGSWIPEELSKKDRDGLLEKMKEDCLAAVDGAIQYGSEESGAGGASGPDDATGTEGRAGAG